MNSSSERRHVKPLRASRRRQALLLLFYASVVIERDNERAAEGARSVSVTGERNYIREEPARRSSIRLFDGKQVGRRTASYANARRTPYMPS